MVDEVLSRLDENALTFEYIKELSDLDEDRALDFLLEWGRTHLQVRPNSSISLLISGGIPYVNVVLYAAIQFLTRQVEGVSVNTSWVSEKDDVPRIKRTSSPQSFLAALGEAIAAARQYEFGNAAAYMGQLVSLIQETEFDAQIKRQTEDLILKWQQAAQAARDLLESGDPDAKDALLKLDLGCNDSNFWDEQNPVHVLSKVEWTFRTKREVMCLVLLVSCIELMCRRLASSANLVTFTDKGRISEAPPWGLYGRSPHSHSTWDGFHTEEFIKWLQPNHDAPAPWQHWQELGYSEGDKVMAGLFRQIKGTLSKKHPQTQRTLRQARNEYVHDLIPIEPEFLNKVDALRITIAKIYSQLKKKAPQSKFSQTLGADIYAYWPDILGEKMTEALETAHPWRQT